MDENVCSYAVIGAAIEVHRHLGPGLLEGAYELALRRELCLRGVRVDRQIALPLTYKGMPLGEALRLDLLVEDLVVVEVKAVKEIAPVHEAQLLTYLRLTDKRLGLLLNFHEAVLRHGVRRIVNRFGEQRGT
jgi:GxxExxY protein